MSEWAMCCLTTLQPWGLWRTLACAVPLFPRFAHNIFNHFPAPLLDAHHMLAWLEELRDCHWTLFVLFMESSCMSSFMLWDSSMNMSEQTVMITSLSIGTIYKQVMYSHSFKSLKKYISASLSFPFFFTILWISSNSAMTTLKKFLNFFADNCKALHRYVLHYLLTLGLFFKSHRATLHI